MPILWSGTGLEGRMLKVILEYSNYSISDRKNICKILAKSNIDILQAKESFWESNPQFTITIDSRSKLNALLFELNSVTTNGVIPKKVVEFDECQKCLANTYNKCSKFRQWMYKIKCKIMSWVNA